MKVYLDNNVIIDIEQEKININELSLRACLKNE